MQNNFILRVSPRKSKVLVIRRHREDVLRSPPIWLKITWIDPFGGIYKSAKPFDFIYLFNFPPPRYDQAKSFFYIFL